MGLAKVRIGGFKVAQSVAELKEALKLFNVSEVVEEEKDDQFFYHVTTTEATKLVERFDGKELLSVIVSAELGKEVEVDRKRKSERASLESNTSKKRFKPVEPPEPSDAK